MYCTCSRTFDIDSCMIARVGPFSSDANAGTQARCQSKRREEGTRAISCVQEVCYLKLLSTVIYCTYIVSIFPAQSQSVNFSSVFSYRLVIGPGRFENRRKGQSYPVR